MKFSDKIFVTVLATNFIILLVMGLLAFQQGVQSFREDKNKQYQRINSRLKESFEYSLPNTPQENLAEALGDRINEYASVYGVEINLYTLQGAFIVGDLRENAPSLSPTLCSELYKKKELITETEIESEHLVEQNRYSYISNDEKPIAILHIKNRFSTDSIRQLKFNLAKKNVGAILFLLILSSVVSWKLSQNMTQKIRTVSTKLEKMDVTFLDQPIHYTPNDEIKPLVEAYNKMLIKLDKQTYQLQKNQREEAWREMAKQVAHEINNPLTPLRLTVQNFQRKYSEDDPNNKEKVRHLVDSVVHQIDIISSITKSFSDFAKMPENQATELDVVETIRRTLDIFPPTVVSFSTNVRHLPFKMDLLHLTRVITNIVKNGIQAIPAHKNKKVEVSLVDTLSDFIITIKDNGDGIPDEVKDRIFEANFTTKSTGMGLGLSMVKSIVEDNGGSITFDTQKGVGTNFYITFKKK